MTLDDLFKSLKPKSDSGCTSAQVKEHCINTTKKDQPDCTNKGHPDRC